MSERSRLLADLITNPSRVLSVTADEARELLALTFTLSGQLVRRLGQDVGGSVPADEPITVAEASRRIGMSEQWIYERADDLPFTRRHGRRVVCSARGVEQYKRQRQGGRP